MRILIVVIIGLVFSSCINRKEIMNSNIGNDAIIQEEDFLDNKSLPNIGKCYARCKIPDQLAVVEEIELNVFTGDDATGLEVEVKEIIVKSARRGWRDVGVDKRIWALLEIPAEVEKVTVVKDISKTNKYERKIFKIERIVESGGYVKTIEVICDELITPKIIQKIQKELIKSGFESITVTGDFDLNTRLALIQYQNKYCLPVDNLSIETAEFMNLEIVVPSS